MEAGLDIASCYCPLSPFEKLEQAARLLTEAKELHDRLELSYPNAMDYTRVDVIRQQTLLHCLALADKYNWAPSSDTVAV